EERERPHPERHADQERRVRQLEREPAEHDDLAHHPNGVQDGREPEATKVAEAEEIALSAGHDLSVGEHSIVERRGDREPSRVYSAAMSGGTVGSASAGVVEDRVIPPGQYWGRVLARGQMLRIVDLEGKQAVDFLCYNARDPADRYAAADTMKINPGGIFLTTGTVLYSVNLTPLFTIIADTCGRHDTIGGCCSAALNKFR